MTLDIITSEALKLRKMERLELIQAMLDSIAIEEADDWGITDKQAKEIERRLARYDAGKAKAIPGNVAHSEIARKYGLQLSTPT